MWLPILASAVAVPGCRGGEQSAADAATDLAPSDVSQPSDVSLRPLSLDFSATGCAAFDLVASRCDGTVPLTVVFTPIASGELTEFLWTFGDLSASSQERSPRHTYSTPGAFTVTLTAGGGPGVGSVNTVHAAYVNVAGAPAGGACDVDQQCANTRPCWCGSSSPCTPVLSRGLCGQACDAATGGPTLCPDGTTCVDLSTGGAAPMDPVTSPPIPTTNPIWRRPLCLPACAEDRDCAAGLRCRDLAAGTSAGGWIRACLGGYPLEIGSRCGDAAGNPVHADCATRLCANLGAFGRCAADCTVAGCPSGSDCAHLGDGRNLCLAYCRETSSCSDDPLLGCETAGSAGALGFTVTGLPASPSYCAPKHCQTASDCGAAGTCTDGHCRRSTP